MASIFISHSSVNKAEAIALRDWLAGEGWDDVFLDLDPERGIVAGERWERALSEAANRCEAVLFLVSRAWLGSRWCLKELNLAHRLNKRLFGVLIEDVPIAELPPDLSSTWQLVNLAAGSDHQLFRALMPDKAEEAHVTFSMSGLSRIKGGLAKAGLDACFFAWPPADEPNRPPYRGLKPLEAEDAGIFFGREAPVIEAIDRLRGLAEAAPPRMLVILGASGAGKSSFLRAGLLPRLARDDRNFLPLPVIRADRTVLTGETGFAHSLDAAFLAQNARCTRAEVKAAIDGGVQALVTLLASLAEMARPPSLPDVPAPKPPALILPIDQGEELFLAEGGEEAEKFLTLLKDIATAAAPDLIVLITIRSDSYERLQMAKALEGIKQDAMSLPPVPHGSYADIIEGPARRLKDTPRALKVEPALTQALLTEIEESGGKDALPLLAFTLERLYVEYGGDGDLTLSEYEQLGRVKGSIEAAVGRALAAANADPKIPKDRSTQLALLRRGLIPWLAGIDPDTGIARRRVARLIEIPEEARPLVELLVEQRLLATDVVPGTGELTIEPAHEALLRQWGLLQTWLLEDSAALTALESVKRAARDWEANGEDASWLTHGGGRLEDAERLRLRPDLAGLLGGADWAYLAACRARETEEKQREEEGRKRELGEARKLAAAQKKIAQRTRIGLIVASVLLVAALAAAWFGFDRARVAREQSAVAKQRTEEAQQNLDAARKNFFSTLTALASAEAEQRPVDGAKLALAAWPRGAATDIPKREATLKALSRSLRGLDERRRVETGAQNHSVAFSPDGARLLTGLLDKTARLWDAATGKQIRTFKGHGQWVASAAFSPDGMQVLTGSEDKTARLWDVATGKEIRAFRGHEALVSSVAFSPDGASVLTGSEDKTARLWDVAAGKEIRAFRGHEAPVSSVAFSPDGARMLTGSEDKTARLWDVATGKEIRAFWGHEALVSSVAFSPDGARMLTGSYDRTARLWDAATGKEIRAFKGHEAPVWSVAFSPDGARVLTGSRDKTARLWDAATGEEIRAFKGHGHYVASVAFSPDGAHVLTGSYDRTARLWDAATGKEIRAFKGHDSGVRSVAFSPNGMQVLTGSDAKTARLWQAETGEELRAFKGHEGSVFSVAFSPDGAHVLTGSEDKTARLWDPATGKEIRAFKGHEGAVHSVAFSPDGKLILTGSADRTARLWQAETGEQLRSFKGHDSGVRSVAFSPNGMQVLTGSDDKTARLWDAEAGEELRAFKGHRREVYSVAFGPDGARVVTGSRDYTARLWNTVTGKELYTFDAGEGGVYSVAFSPDGAHVLTGSNAATVHLWDAKTGQEIRTLKGHKDIVSSVAFSPDGARVLTGSSDNTARLWDISGIPKGSIFDIACAWLLDYRLSGLGRENDLDLSHEAPICQKDASGKFTIPLPGPIN